MHEECVLTPPPHDPSGSKNRLSVLGRTTGRMKEKFTYPFQVKRPSIIPSRKQPNGSKTDFALLGKTAVDTPPPPRRGKVVKFYTKFPPTSSEAVHHRGLF